MTAQGGRARTILLLGTLAFGLVVGAACDSAPVLPENRRPFLYLVLNHTAEIDQETVQPAFLLTMIHADSFVYRGAESFEIRRVSDGTRFDWTSVRVSEPDPFEWPGPAMEAANWILADSRTGDGGGRPSFEPGATYELIVETEGRMIRGRATVPDRFSISVLERDSARVAVWPSVDGAAGYFVDAFGDSIRGHRPQNDTTVRLTPADTAVSVQAVGPHAFRYSTEREARRAGIEGALGVFGAIQGARWEP